ncbi:MAG TPA: endopeptidase La, partial [Epsilonproteobacteria bacterium]|nr:endopeptidase La [Campylobacterota bacterium]
MQLSDYDAFPTVLPIVVEDDLFFYPFMISPIFLSSQEDIDAASHAMENNSLLFVTSTREGREGEREFDAIYSYGVVGSIMRKVHISDGRVKILFQGLARGVITAAQSGSFPRGVVDIIQNEGYNQLKVDALMDILRDKIKQLSAVNSAFPADLLRTIEENDEPHRIADLVSSMLKLTKTKAYELYIENDIEKRLLALVDIIIEEIEAAKVQREIRNKVHSKIEQTNKEYFLKEQLKQIQKDLGVDTQREEEIAHFREKLESIKKYLREDAYNEIKKQ